MYNIAAPPNKLLVLNACMNYEEELVCRLLNGSPDAFDALYRHYFHAVYANILKITRDALIAEDVLQEVFVALWEKRHTININTTGSIAGWLFVTSYHKSINILRRKLKESAIYKELQHTGADLAEDSSSYDRQYAILEKAITKLPPQKRKVFELCKLEGKTYEETAGEMKIFKYTGKEYLSNAVAFVKDYVRQPQHHVAMGLLACILLS